MRVPQRIVFAHAPQRILVVATQRLGDVLLATPLIRSLRMAWPQAHIDALVFDDTASVLEAHPDLAAILTVPRRPRLADHLRLLVRLWRRYDLALSTGAGDRPTLYACLAGRRRIGLVAPGRQHAWKRRLLTVSVPFDDDATHTVVMNLRLADALGIDRSYEVKLGWTQQDQDRVGAELGEASGPYAVLHMSAKFAYKAWHGEGWAVLARWLRDRGFRIVLTGSSEAAELAAIDALRDRLSGDALSVAGRLSLPQVSCLTAGASLVVGPDTVVMHAAAASGVPTLALFGPSNPVKWGPWPRGCRTDPSPFRRIGTQRVGNVLLLQGLGACVPCMQEGCERHIASLSDCLQQMPPERVIASARTVLDEPAHSAVSPH